MKFLVCGSAAAEAVPALFCTCPLCLKALETGGRDVRSRTAYQLGESIRIDCGPDMFYHMVKYRLRYDRLRELIFTHDHRDHFYPDDLSNRYKGMSKLPEGNTLRVIGSAGLLEKVRNSQDTERSKLTLEVAEHGTTLMLHGGVELTAFQANHGAPDSLFYAFRTPEFSLLIANDTGWWSDESWDILKNSGIRLDMAVIEACGCLKYPGWKHSHLSADTCVMMRDELQKIGLIDDKTICVTNHFSHNGGSTHAEMEEFFGKNNMIVAFDGLTIEF